MRDPRDKIAYDLKNWNCPCGGCKKARLDERERIARKLEEFRDEFTAKALDENDNSGIDYKIHAACYELAAAIARENT